MRLSGLQSKILCWLDENPGKLWGDRPSFHGTEPFRRTIHANRRAKFTNKESAAVSRSLKRLEDRGLVVRLQRWGDQPKTWKAELTPEGKRMAERLRPADDNG